ncbi:peroxisomal assembly protein [Cryptotrichosporon argae]
MPIPLRPPTGISATALPLAASPSSSSSPSRDVDAALVSPAVYARLSRRCAQRQTPARPSVDRRDDPPVYACITHAVQRGRKTLVVRVQPDPNVSNEFGGETIYISPHLTPTSGPITLSPHTPVTLSLLVLRPTRATPVSLPRLDTHTVFRLNVPTTIDRQTFIPILTEPVAQGVVGMSTQVVLAPPAAAPTDGAWPDLDADSVAGTHVSLADFDPDAFLGVDMRIAQDAPAGPVGDDNANGDGDGYSDGDGYGSEATTHARADGQHAPAPDADAQSTASLSTSGSLTPRPDGHGRGRTHPLSPEPAEPDALAFVPHVAHGTDDGVALSVVGLARAGVFDGDWVIVSTPTGGRLARATAHEDPDAPLDQINVPPQLARTLGSASRLVVSPTPFGPRAPTLPVARAVTLARVATAEAVDKRYEPGWVAGLRAHFRAPRIVRRGDVLGVPVSLPARDAADNNADADAGTDAQPGKATAAIYFRVTALDFEPLVHPEIDFRVGVASKARAGEMGCWVDCEGTLELAEQGHTGKTRMVVEGVERARIADRGGDKTWLGLHPEPPVVGSAAGRLRQLFEVSFKSPHAVSVLVQAGRGAGKSTLVRALADEVGMSVVTINAPDLAAEPRAVLEGTLAAALDKARAAAPAVLLLHHVDALCPSSAATPAARGGIVGRVLADLVRGAGTEDGWPVVVVGTSTEDVDKDVRACFKQELVLDAPNEAERRQLIEQVFATAALAPDVDLAALGAQTASFLSADLSALAWRVSDLALQRACASSRTGGSSGLAPSVRDVVQSTPLVGQPDIEAALDEARRGLADRSGAPRIPKVRWDDVGGLESVKQDILDTVQLPLEHPELFAKGLRKRSGILLYGPPGTGKTLLAKAVATTCALNFLSVKGPELLNMYIGESEANVRRVFARARAASPCVVFMDELDAVAPKRGDHGDSAGVMDRIVAQLLAELDGAGEKADVVVMAATNRPDLLDPALLRPGRFDKMLYLGPPVSHAAQAAVLCALTRGFTLDPALDMAAVARRLPLTLTGADLYALCADAMLGALGRVAAAVDGEIAALEDERDQAERSGHGHSERNGMVGAGQSKHQHAWPRPLTPAYYLDTMRPGLDVVVGADDFARAASALRPSVSEGEMAHYRRVQDEFRAFSIGA